MVMDNIFTIQPTLMPFLAIQCQLPEGCVASCKMHSLPNILPIHYTNRGKLKFQVGKRYKSGFISRDSLQNFFCIQPGCSVLHGRTPYSCTVLMLPYHLFLISSLMRCYLSRSRFQLSSHRRGRRGRQAEREGGMANGERHCRVITPREPLTQSTVVHCE